jgi:hypothetical protein
VGSIDSNTWQLLNVVVLTVLGIVVSGILWRTRGAASGVRGLAWSLLPGAAYLTGTLTLLWQIGDAVSSWAVSFVFNPFVWVGLGLGGVSAALFLTAHQMRRRGLGRKGRATSPPPAGRLPAQRSDRAAAPVDDDMADIEAILRKHGIS